MPTVSWLYTFGDGRSSTEKDPTHVYKMPGIYILIQQVTDSNGDTSTSTATVYVYDWGYGPGDLNVARTTQCLRYSMKPTNGFGWSEFGGSGFPFPEARVGTMKVQDSADREHLIVLDAATGRIIEVGRRDIFQDLLNGGSYVTPLEIDTEARFREETGSAEHYFLRSLGHHAHFRPHDEDNKGASGYTSVGYRTAFSVDFILRKDGEQVLDTLKAEDVPLDGDYTFKYEEEAHRWQPVIRTTASEFKLIKMRNYYQQMDKAATPANRDMTENSYQTELANSAVHLSRNQLTPLLNFSTGGVFTGSYTGLVTGPDSRPNSAFSFASGQRVTSDATVSLTGDFTVCFWLSSIVAPVTVVSQASGFQVAVIASGSGYQVQYQDAAGNIRAGNLSWTNSGWVLITVQRDGALLRMYENSTQIFSQDLDSVESYSDPVVVMNNEVGRVFDVRVINQVLSAGAVGFHYNDVTQHNGKSTCPLF